MNWHYLNDTRLIVWTFNKNNMSGCLKVCPSNYPKKYTFQSWVIFQHNIWLVVRFTLYRFVAIMKCLFIIEVNGVVHHVCSGPIALTTVCVCTDVDGKIAIWNVNWNFVIILWREVYLYGILPHNLSINGL